MRGLKSAKSAEFHKKNSMQIHPEFTSYESIGTSGDKPENGTLVK
jgi:hypothetical protein